MTVDYIRIDVDILRHPGLSDKAKMLLGLVRSFNGNGLLMGNSGLADLLCTSPKHITRLLAEIKDHIRVENAQSKYRKIFYLHQNAGVEKKLLPQKGVSGDNLLPHTGELLPHSCGHTTAYTRNITKITENKKSPKRTFSPDSVEIRFSQLLLDLILERKPDYKCPDIQSWAKQVDLMISVDKRAPERIESVIRWCQADAGNGNGWAGWQNNILSTAKLREKYDKLEFSMGKIIKTVPLDFAAKRQREAALIGVAV